MIVDKKYCMSSFLMYRKIMDENHQFQADVLPFFPKEDFDQLEVADSQSLATALKRQVQDATRDGKAAIALSGGIDSAILAKFMPKGSTAYTFKCIVPGVKVVDETEAAAKYAEECGLKHKVVEIYWDDFKEYAPKLMAHKGAPIHSIEVQIYKAAMQAKTDGFERLIFGESADVNFGGHSGLLSKDWLIGDFIDRYSYVLPYKVLRDSQLVLEPIQKYEENGYVNVHEFNRNEYFKESIGSYANATSTADFGLVMPFSHCRLKGKLDIDRVRRGENKYLVREVFNRLYKGFELPEKVPMPRATNEWLRDWDGPKRPEFYPNCVTEMSGDQKWLVMALEMFLNEING